MAALGVLSFQQLWRQVLAGSEIHGLKDEPTGQTSPPLHRAPPLAPAKGKTCTCKCPFPRRLPASFQGRRDHFEDVTMGQNPVPPMNIPIPTKIGSKMGGEFTYPKMGSHWFETHSHVTFNRTPKYRLSIKADSQLSEPTRPRGLFEIGGFLGGVQNGAVLKTPDTCLHPSPQKNTGTKAPIEACWFRKE